MKRITTFAALACALAAVPAAAQDDPVFTVTVDTTPAPPNGLAKGAWSLSFAAFGGERAEFGVWEMIGSRTNLGLSLEVNAFGRERDLDGSEETTEATTSVGLGVNVRRFLATERRVAPFVQGRIFGRGSYTRRESGDFEEVTRGRNVGAEAGVGAEWFPVRQFSVSGYTGARFTAGRYEVEQEDPEGETVEAAYNDGGFQTFTSALSVHIYF